MIVAGIFAQTWQSGLGLPSGHQEVQEGNRWLCQSTHFLSFVRCRFINFVLTFPFTTTAKARTSDTATKRLQTNKHNLMIKQTHRQSGISCGQTSGLLNIRFPAYIITFSKLFIAFISTFLKLIVNYIITFSKLFIAFIFTFLKLIINYIIIFSKLFIVLSSHDATPCRATLWPATEDCRSPVSPSHNNRVLLVPALCLGWFSVTFCQLPTIIECH